MSTATRTAALHLYRLRASRCGTMRAQFRHDPVPEVPHDTDGAPPMKKLAALLAAGAFALSTAALAQTTPAKPATPATPAAATPAKLEKPASVTQADWDKMSEADKKKAVEAAKSAAAKPAAEKKPKKGGC
jgi:hypothetical protein